MQNPPSRPGTVPDILAADKPVKVWHVGTLTYTTTGLVVLFCWLLWGDFAWSMKERSVLPVFQSLIKTYGASDTLAGVLVTFLPPALGLLISPIVSYKSDRHRGRWGRRIPFLVIPTPVAVLAMVGLAMSPWIGSSVRHASLSPLIFLGLFWTIFEAATTIANAVFGAFVNDVVPRPVLGRFYALFRALSLIAGMIFNFWLFGKAQQHYVAIFLGTGLLYGVGFTVMCLKVKEGDYPPVDDKAAEGFPIVVETESLEGSPVNNPVLADPPAVVENQPPETPRQTRSSATSEYLRDCFSKPYYRWFYAALILPALASLPINTFNLYFSDSVGMTRDAFGKLQALYFGLSLLQTLPIGWLVDRYDPIRVAIVALLLHAAAALWGGLFIHSASTFGVAYVLTGAFSGTWLTATASLASVLLPKMKFAQYLSAMAIVNSLCTMTAGPAMGRWLDHTKHAFGQTQYYYTYLIGGIFDILGLLVTVVLLKKFVALGGKKHYSAP